LVRRVTLSIRRLLPIAVLLLGQIGANSEDRLPCIPWTTPHRKGSPQRQFGRLTLLGGLILNDSRFRGIGGFRLDSEGQNYLAVDEEGHWFRGRLQVSAEGAPQAMTVSSWGAIPLDEVQAEALAIQGDRIYLGLEDPHKIVMGPADWISGPFTPVATELNSWLSDLPRNQGVEALTLTQEGELFMVTEGCRGDTQLPVHLWNPISNAYRSLWLARTAEYDVSDCATLPGGAIVLLERNASRKLRLRLLSREELSLDRVMQGEILLEWDGAEYLVPPFEALSAHPAGPGDGVILTLVSDNGDRYSRRHATRLLQFRLK